MTDRVLLQEEWKSTFTWIPRRTLSGRISWFEKLHKRMKIVARYSDMPSALRPDRMEVIFLVEYANTFDMLGEL